MKYSLLDIQLILIPLFLYNCIPKAVQSAFKKKELWKIFLNIIQFHLFKVSSFLDEFLIYFSFFLFLSRKTKDCIVF